MQIEMHNPIITLSVLSQKDGTKSTFAAFLPVIPTKTLGPRALSLPFRPQSPHLCTHIKPKLKKRAQGCQARQC